MSDEPPPNFRILKIVVVVLGIAILGMTGIIIVKGIEKFGSSDEAPSVAPAPAAANPAPAPAPSSEPWQATVGKGRIVSAEVDGGLLMILIEDEGGAHRVEVRDAVTGALRGQAIAE